MDCRLSTVLSKRCRAERGTRENEERVQRGRAEKGRCADGSGTGPVSGGVNLEWSILLGPRGCVWRGISHVHMGIA